MIPSGFVEVSPFPQSLVGLNPHLCWYPLINRSVKSSHQFIFSSYVKITPPVKTRAVLQSGISDVLQDMWHFWMPFHECSYFILLCAWVCIMTHRQIYIYIYIYMCVCVCELEELFHVFVQPYACLKNDINYRRPRRPPPLTPTPAYVT